jgi:hypothetical protein
MNIPVLKCARGYHKRGREFKVLYSGTACFMAAGSFKHLLMQVILLVLQSMFSGYEHIPEPVIF